MDLHRWLLSAAAIGVMAAAPLEAQTLHPGPTPIDLAVHPVSAAVGASIRLSGLTGHDGHRRTVRLVVFSPAGTAVRLAATADPAGHFIVTFRQTRTPGTYRVQAASPDEKGRATAAFTIFTAAGVVQTNVTAIDAVAADAESAVDAIRRALPSIPVSPERRELERRLVDLNARLVAAPQQAAALAGVWGRLQQVARRYPVLAPAFAGTVRAMTEWNEEANEERPRIRDALQRITNGRACDLAERSVETVGWITRAIDLISRPMALLRDLDSVAGVESRAAGSLRLMTPVEREEARKRLALAVAPSLARPVVPWDPARVRLAATVTEAAGVRLMDSTCERLEGPLSASLHAELVRNGRRLWQYDMALEGRLHLRYTKTAPVRGTIAVTGHVDGRATRITLSDAFLAADPRGGTEVLWHADRPPDLEAASFRIPVEGELRGGTMTLRLRPAGYDWHLVGRVSYVLITPGAFVPETLTAEFPFPSASWLLSRTIGAEAVFALQAGTGPAVPAISRRFMRTLSADAVRFTTRLSLVACRPSCPR